MDAALLLSSRELNAVHMPAVFFVLNTKQYRWFSRYVIAGMLVDGKQKIAH